jgi:mRNA-degrading endonuclease RelE of RelBE toxin-antitoxin system
MEYIITFRDSFLRDLTKSPRYVQERLARSVGPELRKTPDRIGGNIKKLKGYNLLWRYRIDDYRIIYAILDNFVEYLAAASRRDIYERFHYNNDEIQLI